MTPAEITDAGAAYSAGLRDAFDGRVMQTTTWKSKGLHGWRAYIAGFEYACERIADEENHNDLI